MYSASRPTRCHPVMQAGRPHQHTLVRHLSTIGSARAAGGVCVDVRKRSHFRKSKQSENFGAPIGGAGKVFFRA